MIHEKFLLCFRFLIQNTAFYHTKIIKNGYIVYFYLRNCNFFTFS